MPVMVANPVLKTVALTETYTGRFTPVEEVDLQARVSGYLESVHFTEGQQIEKGDLMFRIDPRVFDAALSRAIPCGSRPEAGGCPSWPRRKQFCHIRKTGKTKRRFPRGI